MVLLHNGQIIFDISCQKMTRYLRACILDDCDGVRYLSDLIVADLEQGTLQDAHLKTNKSGEISVDVGSRLFA